MNTNGQSNADNRPLWQKISGIDPQTEQDMTRDQRDAALRKLVQEAHARAVAEFASDDEGKIPAGERTIFWDPMHRVCAELGISRTKLSSYSRELTGMRAHEISDRIQAKRVVEKRLANWVNQMVRPELEAIRNEMVTTEFVDAEFIREQKTQFVRWMKNFRKPEFRAAFAAEMGFANYSRLNKACLLAFGASLDHLESNLVCTLVQKFFDELTQSRKDAKKPQKLEKEKKNEPILTDEEKAAGDRIIKEVVQEVLGMRQPKVCVA